MAKIGFPRIWRSRSLANGKPSPGDVGLVIGTGVGGHNPAHPCDVPDLGSCKMDVELVSPADQNTPVNVVRALTRVVEPVSESDSVSHQKSQEIRMATMNVGAAMGRQSATPQVGACFGPFALRKWLALGFVSLIANSGKAVWSDQVKRFVRFGRDRENSVSMGRAPPHADHSGGCPALSDRARATVAWVGDEVRVSTRSPRSL